jgi:hypothetical protein
MEMNAFDGFRHNLLALAEAAGVMYRGQSWRYQQPERSSRYYDVSTV